MRGILPDGLSAGAPQPPQMALARTKYPSSVSKHPLHRLILVPVRLPESKETVGRRLGEHSSHELHGGTVVAQFRRNAVHEISRRLLLLCFISGSRRCATARDTVSTGISTGMGDRGIRAVQAHPERRHVMSGYTASKTSQIAQPSSGAIHGASSCGSTLHLCYGSKVCDSCFSGSLVMVPVPAGFQHLRREHSRLPRAVLVVASKNLAMPCI